MNIQNTKPTRQQNSITEVGHK